MYHKDCRRVSGCQDEFYTCHLWAAKGECSANQVWMKKHCKRSCSACGGTLVNRQISLFLKNVHMPGFEYESYYISYLHRRVRLIAYCFNDHMVGIHTQLKGSVKLLLLIWRFS